MWIKEFFKNTALVCGSILFTLVLLELGIRLIMPQHFYYPRYIYQTDDYSGHKLRPGFEGRLTHTDYNVSCTITDQGLRDIQLYAKEKSRPRIIGLGDSYTFGYGVEVGRSYTKIVEHLANVEYINAGVPAYGAVHELALYNHYLKNRFDHDLVTLLVCINDFQDDTKGVARKVKGGYLVPLNSNNEGLQYALTWMSDHSHLFFLLANHLRKSEFLYKFFRDGDGNAGVPAEHKEKQASEKITTTLKKILEIRDMANSRGAKFAVFFINDAQSDFEEFKLLGHSLQENSVPYLDLIDAFRPFEPNSYILPNDGHWNEKGHKIAADAIHTFLVEENLLFPPFTTFITRTNEAGQD